MSVGSNLLSRRKMELAHAGCYGHLKMRHNLDFDVRAFWQRGNLDG
jgi:hypothetical protein